MDQLTENQILLSMLLCTKYGFTQHTTFDWTEDCAICLEPMQNKFVMQTPCEHYFDINCLHSTIQNKFFKCPECMMQYKQQ